MLLKLPTSNSLKSRCVTSLKGVGADSLLFFNKKKNIPCRKNSHALENTKMKLYSGRI